MSENIIKSATIGQTLYYINPFSKNGDIQKLVEIEELTIKEIHIREGWFLCSNEDCNNIQHYARDYNTDGIQMNTFSKEEAEVHLNLVHSDKFADDVRHHHARFDNSYDIYKK